MNTKPLFYQIGSEWVVEVLVPTDYTSVHWHWKRLARGGKPTRALDDEGCLYPSKSAAEESLALYLLQQGG